MGLLADAVLEGGGQVIGVIPRPLVDREVAASRPVGTPGRGFNAPNGRSRWRNSPMRLSRCWVVWERSKSCSKSGPGHNWVSTESPVGLLNAEGYYDSLLEFLNHAEAENFIESKNWSMLTLGEGADQLLDCLESYQDPGVPRWVEESEI